MYKKCPKNVQKRAKTCKKRASQVLMHQKRASQVLISQKNVQKRAKMCKNMQKHASQVFLDPIQKRASSRSVQLEAVLLKALLYIIICFILLINLY